MTGVTIFENLAPETRYIFQMGWFFSEKSYSEIPDNLRINWTQASTGEVTTASANPQAPRQFIFGSCRYLLRLFLGSLFDTRGVRRQLQPAQVNYLAGYEIAYSKHDHLLSWRQLPLY